MKRGNWLILSSLVIAGLFLAACAPAVAPTPTPKPKPAVAETPKPAIPTPTPKPAVEQPRYGGTLKQSIYADIPHIDPHREVWFGVAQMGESVWEGLLRYDCETGTKIEPSLAEKWEISPDGTIITFSLRQGVKWHDGRPLTSADAKYSLERLANPPKGFINPRIEAFESVAKVEAPSDSRVVLTLKYPNVLILDSLAYANHVVLPKHVVEPLGATGISDVKQAIGTGPFKLDNYVRGVSWKLVKNVNFWKPGLPYLDAVQTFVVPDITARTAAFRTKRLDILDKSPGLAPPQLAILQKEKGVVISMAPVFSLWAVWMNPSQPGPLADVRIRKAIHLLLDRDKLQDVLVESVIRGEIGGLIYPMHPFAQPREEIQKWPGFRQPKDPDVTEARKLLDEAGYGKGFELKLVSAIRAGVVENNTAVMDQLKKFGIAAKMDLVESAAWLDIQEKGRYASSVNAFGTWSADPHFALAARFKTAGGRNYEKTSDPRIDALHDEQARSLDPEKRKQLIREMERRLLNDVVVSAPLYWKRNATAYWQHVKGYSGMNAQGVFGGYSAESVWIAK